MAKRRSTIGANPLDSLVPASAPASPSPSNGQTKNGGAKAASASTSRERLTVNLPVELIDRIKNAVYWTPGLTLTQLAEESFLKQLAKLEKERGEPFPQRDQPLKRGRPLS